jgi:copper chaperone
MNRGAVQFLTDISQKRNPKEKTMTSVTYFIPSISCGNCKRTIETRLGQLDGIQSVKVEIATRQVAVTFNSPATENAIKALLARINYPVQNNA